MGIPNVSSVLTGLESEKKWIDEHPEYYTNKQHQEAVKRAIEYRYRLNAMLTKLNQVLGK